MDSLRKKLLEESYDRVINVGFCLEPYQDLSDMIEPDVMIFGTTKDEQIFSLAELIEFFKSQYAQMENFEPSLQRKRLHTRVSDDHNSAIISEEITLCLASDEVINSIYMRTSCVMHYATDRWKVTHWHASTPVDTENDHWHMEEWKRENEKLQKLVDQQTADLQIKNRELEIEAALERIRSSSLAMQKTDNLRDVVAVLFEQMQELSVDMGFASVSIFIFEEGSRDFVQWLPTPEGVASLAVPYIDHPISSDLFDARENGADYFEKIYTVEEKNEWLEKGFEATDYKNLPPEFKASLLEAPGYAMSISLAKHSGICIPSFEGKLPSPENVAILKRVSNVFEQAYIRFLDLQKAERQAREAQIEAALERVRSKSLAMHKTAELQSVIHAVHQELLNLNLSISGGSFIIINKEIDNDLLCWGSGGTADYSDLVHIPHFEKPFYTHLLNKIKSGPGFFTEEYTREEKVEFFSFLFQHEPWSSLNSKQKEETLSEPGGYTRSCIVSKHTSIFIINHFGEKFSEAENAILRRFGKVFEQSYTRFLDLQKAEAQAREAEIELALERVRARTMAMQNSEELAEVSSLLFQQMEALGVHTYSSGFTIWDEDRDKLISWVCNADGSLNPPFYLPMTEEPWHREQYKSWKKGEDFIVKDLAGEEWKSYFRYLRSFPLLDEAFAISEAAGHPMPERQVHHAANFSHGNLLFITLEPRPEAHELFKRFAKIFEQTYTRFLDLKKAEEQAKEARIEAALERVRSRSLAMHHSSELSSVVDTLLREFTNLEYSLTFCIINLINEQDMSNTVWAANPETGKDAESYYMKFEDYPFHHAMWDAWKAQKKRFIYTIEGEEKKTYDEYLYSETEFRRFPEEVKEANKALSRYVAGFTFFKHSGLQTVSEDTISEKDLAILERFGRVFEQAYTRFLDLQKAERQAREAQIELSLERIRAQVTAMQESSDLLDIVVTMRTEFVKLGHKAHYFWHMRWLPEHYKKAMTSGDGSRIGMVMTLPRHIHGDIEPVAEWEKSDDPTHILAMDVDTAVEYVDKMITLGNFEQVDPQAPTLDDIRHIGGLTFVMARTGHGEIGYSLPGVVPDPPKDAVDTLVRFAGVFDLAYKRFEDLKAAERQHREAQIELALERVRARTMAMQSSDEFADVAAVLFDQVRTLGGNLWGTGFGLCEENADNDEFWFANENGVFPAVSIPNTEDPAHKQMYEGWKNNEEFLALEGSGEDLKNHYNYMMTLPEVRPFFQKILDEGLTFPEWQQWNAAYFSHGYLLIITLEPYSNQEILKRFARVFNQTYTRFLDLKKAEAQARESEIQLALERVRARSMAMHKSDELADLSLELVKQVQALGIDTWFCAFNIYDDHPEGSLEWGSNGQGTFPQYRTPREGVFLDYYEAGQQGETLLINEIDEKECPAHYEYLCSLPGVGEQLLQMKDEGIPFPVYQIDHAAFFRYGYILFITFEPVPEAHDIFKRFAKVFQQTYTRFLDLQKSEAQAREAQIEAALERVRSRSMAMHKTEELADAIGLLQRELAQLEFALDNCIFWIIDKESNEATLWVAPVNDTHLPEPYHVPFTNLPYFREVFRAWELRNPKWTYVLEGKDKKRVDEYLFNQTDFRSFPADIKNIFLQVKKTYVSISFYNYGGLHVSTEAPISESQREILSRFSKVFDQTYTRFLDLQKAEAQTREAQINLAVERVRAKALAMFKSEEILDVVYKLKEEIMGLNIPSVSAATIHLKEPDGRYRTWDLTSIDGEANELEISLDISYNMDDTHPDFFMREVWERTEDYFVVIQDTDRTPHTVQWLEQNGYSREAKDFEEFLESGQLEQAYHPTVPLNNGRMSIDLLEPPEPEVESILKKMAGAFDLAYKRFEDLQKAEAQTREAQLELSLERIRAQVTAMQESSDLFDVVVSMRNEFLSLGHQADYFWHMRWLPESYEMSMTSEAGDRIGMVITIPGFVHEDIPGLTEWEKGDDPTYVLALDAVGAWEYIENMNTHGRYEVADPNAPTWEDIEQIGGLTFIMARTTHGEIGYSLPGMVPNPPRDSVDTLVRFAGVFDLAYKRFEDLKAAERQALLIREERDRLEIALNELHATQDQLVQQEKLASLGQLTAGIAHEIKNPLNFVNNFSEVSVELIEEAKEEVRSQKSGVRSGQSEILELLDDIKMNLVKIHEHGSRADSIVKSMLEHSRGGSGKPEPTNLNALVKEFTNLSFHGMRASKEPINVDMKYELDESIGELPLVAEDFSRVIVNLCNNAFDALREKANVKRETADLYEPKLIVQTESKDSTVTIEIEDNGPGIPEEMRDKILQPFFTTKKGTQGTGLGLSITNDIVKAHGGVLNVSTQAGKGTTFTIELPK